MTDFYKNPPRTKEDIRNYLTSWLQKVDNKDKFSVIVQGELFVLEWEFRRATHSHGVFRSLSTNKYVWWVFETINLDKFPKQRFDTYESLLENVINDYYILWKLNE